MIFKKLIKNAAEEKDIKLIKGWNDDYGNTMVVFQISGKKYGFIRMGGEWFYFLGIGSNGQTKDMPAGRGDYLTAQKVIGSDSDLFSSIVEKSQIPFSKLNNKTGSSWAPINEEQKKGLAKLIDDVGAINDYLSQMGILYTGGDKLIFGDDITGKDILEWKIPVSRLPEKRRVEAPQQKSTKSRSYNLPQDEEAYWREKFYDTAASQVGVPYYWGGDDPGKGFDCSGLVHWTLDKSGLIPGAPDDVAAGQMNLGSPIGAGELKKGDLIGFRTSGGVPHIGIYTGEGTSYLSASGGGRNTKGNNPRAKVQIGDYTRYGAPAFFASIAPLIEKRLSSKNMV